MRLPSLRRTWWNATSFSSVAEYSRTGIVTSPNDTVPFQIERIAPPGLLPLRTKVRIAPRRVRCDHVARRGPGRCGGRRATAVAVEPRKGPLPTRGRLSRVHQGRGRGL